MNRMISDLPDLAQRVEKLEKANRRLKLAGVLALALVGCLLLLGVASPKRTVEAEAFVLRDANGKLRALLAVAAEGPGLSFIDANEKQRMLLEVSAEGPLVSLRDANGKSRMALGVLGDGLDAKTALILYDSNRKARMTLIVAWDVRLQHI